MKRRIILIIVIVILSFLLWLSKYLLSQSTISFCHNDFLCVSLWFRGILWPLHDSFIYLIIAIIPFIFLPFSFLKIWLKIMIPYFVIVLILTIFTPDVCSGFLCWDRTLVASGFAKLFLILTILIIIGKFIQLFMASRRSKKI